MMEKLETVVADVSSNRSEVIEKLITFSGLDMLLFWGEDKDLILREKKLWQPILEWASGDLKTDIKTSKSFDAPRQSGDTGKGLARFLAGLTDKELACFYLVSMKLKSFLLAAAFIREAFSIEKIMHAAFLEEEFQEEVWGKKDDVRSNFEAVKKELEEIKAFLERR